jgi:carbon storage regulator
VLILSRKPNERIIIDDKIEVVIINIKGDQVKLGVTAPDTVKVYRYEVFKAVQLENSVATQAKLADLPVLHGFGLGVKVKN